MRKLIIDTEVLRSGIWGEFFLLPTLARRILGKLSANVSQQNFPANFSPRFLSCFHASFFPFCPLCWPPLLLSFSRHFFALFSPSKMLFSVERRGHHRAWRGAVLGRTPPEISRRKFLPEICVKKGQVSGPPRKFTPKMSLQFLHIFEPILFFFTPIFCLRRRPISQGTRNGAFGKPCLCPRDTRDFRHFVVWWGLRSKALVLLVRTQTRHVRHFRQNPLVLAGLPKAPFLGPRNGRERRLRDQNYKVHQCFPFLFVFWQ